MTYTIFKFAHHQNYVYGVFAQNKKGTVKKLSTYLYDDIYDLCRNLILETTEYDKQYLLDRGGIPILEVFALKNINIDYLQKHHPEVFL